jgi:Fur family transcriptional regulator, ferric uptake regulator
MAGPKASVGRAGGPGRGLSGGARARRPSGAPEPDHSSGPPWVEQALDALRRAGYRSSRPRTAVVEALGRRSCLVSAQRLAEEMRADGRDVGIATVYRTLELLDELGLVQRLEASEGAVGYEPAGPRGEHHHHLVCSRCDRVVPFEDEGLERAIARASRRLAGRVDAHDVTLRGLCPPCARDRAR